MKDFISDEEMAKLETPTSPDFISDDEMAKFDVTPPSVAPQSAAPKTSMSEALGKGFSQGATFGFGDELTGVGGALSRGVNYLRGKTLGDKGILDALKTGYITERDADRAYNEQLQKENPISYTGASIASGLPAIGAKTAVTIPMMVGQGALSGLGTAQGDLSTQAAQTALGGGIAGGLGLAAQGIGKGAQALKTSLGLKGLGATKGAVKQIGENSDDVVQSALDSGALTPFRNQQAANQRALQESGQAIGNIRQQLPPVDLDVVQQAIANRASGLTNLSLDEQAANQVARLTSDVGKLAKDNKIDLLDLVSLKSKIGDASRTTFGDLSKNKEGLEIVRKALRDVEVDTASKMAPEYVKLLRKNSTAQTVGKLLEDKEAANTASSILGLGGMIGGAAGAGYAGATGDPKGLLLAAIMSRKGREVLAKSGAKSIDSVQKLATKLNMDPKLVAYLIGRQNTGE